MTITLDEKYNAKTDTTTLGYVGETNARAITFEGYQCDGADSYKMRFKYPDGVTYDVDILDGTYTIDGSILRCVGAVYAQVLACKQNGDSGDNYEYVKKSDILTLHIGRSLNGGVSPVPTYEQSVEVLEKVFSAEKSSAENAQKSVTASSAAQAAQNAAETAKEMAEKLVTAAEEAAENAAQSETAAQIAADTATDKAKEISESAEQIQKNTADIAKLYSKSDGIVCKSEGSAIVLTDSSELPFNGMRIFGRSEQNGTPSPDNPVPIVSVGGSGNIHVDVFGGNLFDAQKIVPNPGSDVSVTAQGARLELINNTGGQYKSMYYAIDRDFSNIELTLSANITASGNADGCVSVRFYSNGTEINGYRSRLDLYNSGVKTKTAPACTDRIRIVVYSSYQKNANVGDTVIYDNIMLNIGSTAFPYEPYKHQSITLSTPNGLPGIPVDSGGNYTDENGQQWICDEIDLGRGVYVQRVGKWQYTNENVNCGLYGQGVNINRFSIHAEISNVKSASGNGYCNIFNYAYNPINDNSRNNTIVVHKSGNIYCRCDDYQTADDFISVLSEKRPICLYILAGAIETPLSAEEISAYKSLHTNKPTTTITNSDSAHMAVSYTADTKTYIDNKFNELATAIIATGGDA